MNRLVKSLWALVPSIAFVAAACGPQAASSPPSTSVAKATAPQSSATVTSQERKELTLIKSVRPILADTVTALQKGDIAAAKAAWAPYDGKWNGIEVYINVRSVATYQELETKYEAEITKQLEAAQPNAGDILPTAQAMLAKYDEVIRTAENGPAISPLFDDVADLRITRAPLREVAPALKAGDLVKAKASFHAFRSGLPSVVKLIDVRSTDLSKEIAQAISAVDAAWQKPQPTATELSPLVEAVTNRYNYGVNLVTTAARKADLAKSSPAEEDVKAATGVRAIQTELATSMAAWNSGKYQDASASATRAAGELFIVSTLAAPLKAKSLDATFKTALDAYAKLAAGPGDASKAGAANKAAVEAGEIAIQGLVGQFWTDPKLQASVTVVKK